ncbi:hypothetical protein K9N50_08345 [bacterium]|nr:hypothetical protein [bacterium]
MKYRPIAIDIINRLRSQKYIEGDVYTDLISQIENGRCFETFDLLKSRMVKAGWAVGWNKILCNGVIYSWYSDHVTVIPLRLAVMEIESNDALYNSCRSALTELWRDDLKQSVDSMSSERLRNLQELGVNPLHGSLNKSGMTLLHRLNTDMRDRPLIARMHWAGGVGAVVLSDGGKYQVSRDAVWASAIDAGIRSDGKLDAVLKDSLLKIFPETTELDIAAEQDKELKSRMNRFLSLLTFYRIAKAEIDRIIFIVEPGNFPKLALKLWG